MKVYITKYALTKGIFTKDAEPCYGGGIVFEEPGHYMKYYYGQDWHKTEAEAIKRANEMKKKKIASLQKQLKRIQALTFESGIESK